MPTPFGNLYVPNITPDDETGIGQWTADEFYRMMHTGVSRDGTLLYPAMPFASYTKVTREDSDAIFAYLMSVPPVKPEEPAARAALPVQQARPADRLAHALLQGRRVRARPEAVGAMEPRRVPRQGLGHCAMCHTAINALGGSSESKAFEGGMIPNQNWYAPSLTSNREAGLGNWSIKDIADLLQVGVSHRGTVYGPMAEVVYNSLQYLTRRRRRGDGGLPEGAAAARRRAAADEPGAPGAARGDGDWAARSTRSSARCATATKGKGQPPAYPPLAGNQSITMASPVNSIRMVLNGGYPPGTQQEPAAARHAAVLAHPERRRGGGGRHLHPRRLGEQRHAGDAARRSTSCASCCPNEERDDAPSRRRSRERRRDRRRAVDEIVRRGPSGAFAVAGVATAIVVAIYFAFYFVVYLPRGAVQ